MTTSYDEQAGSDAAALEVPRAVELYKRPPVLPTSDEFAFIFQMAEALAGSQLVPSSARGKPADVAIVLLAARDMGIPLTQAFAKLHVIEGKLTLSAEVMVALVLRDGHALWCESVTGQAATAAGQRKGSPHVGRFTFTLEDATTAALTSKDNWKKYPKAMLWARAVSGLVRMLFPDVTAGVSYTPEEIGDDERFSAYPATGLDPAVREELAGRIALLDEDQKTRLKLAWATWGLSPLSRLTEEESEVALDLIAKAEAIDVEADQEDAKRDAAQGAPSAERPDGPPEPAEPATEPQGAAEDAYDLPPLDGERAPRTCVCGHLLGSHGGVEGWTCRGDGIAPCDCTEWRERPEPGPDDCPECGHPATAHGSKGCEDCFCKRDRKEARAPANEFEVGDASAPIDATTGHCSACGGAIYRDDVGLWNHADDEDEQFCQATEPRPAGPTVDVDALYAAVRAPQATNGDSGPDVSIEAQVAALTPTEVMVELRAAGLSVAGTLKARRERLFAHRKTAV